MESVENCSDPLVQGFFRLHRAGESCCPDEEKQLFPPDSTTWGNREGHPLKMLGLGFHSFQTRFSSGFRRQFVMRPFACSACRLQKLLDRGRRHAGAWPGARCADASETHHFRHCPQIRIQIRVEGSVVVADGAIGVLQPVAGQDADHGGT